MPFEPHPSVYAFIGRRIRERRKALKLSQGKLAELMGVSYQQIQKYEAGVSQASVGRLLHFAAALGVPPGYFYEGVKIEEPIGQGIGGDIPPEIRSTALRILLLQDNPAATLAFRQALDGSGIAAELHVVRGGAALLDFLAHHQTKYAKPAPELVVLDGTLASAAAMQLLKSLKSKAETSGIPVVLLGHGHSRKELQEAYRAGAAGFIRHSADPSRLRGAIGAAATYWAEAVALPNML